ncbi:MAG: GAF domain-containing protein, partial [Calditrichaeota bacterium]
LTFDALSDERFDDSQSVILQQIRSIACVPLMFKDNFSGMIYIDSRGKKARFTRESLDFLQAFANQAAIALENVRLLVQLQEENALLKEEFHRLYSFKEIIGKSAAMQNVYRTIGKVLNNDTTVLIQGETGTGKELIARAIHYNGWRKEYPFVPVNCAAIPENLIESELFGHKKGSFTGAISDKKGLIAAADKGTLFLDEIGELPASAQVKLLRFLQDKEFTPVGEIKPTHADVRILAATNKDLLKQVQEGNFREDLYYRLNIINVQVPALRNRMEDIPLLIHHFLDRYNRKLSRNIRKIDNAVMKMFMSYSWPGNIRELENTIERAVVMSSRPIITEEDILLPENSVQKNTVRAGMTLEEVSRQLLDRTLKAVDGNKTRAAEMMEVSLRWIHYKMKEWKL